MSPTCALHSGTTTLTPCWDSPTQPYSILAITVTSSLTCIGMKFHGVNSKTRTTAVPAATLPYIASRGGFFSFCFNISFHYKYVKTGYNTQKQLPHTVSTFESYKWEMSICFIINLKNNFVCLQ